MISRGSFLILCCHCVYDKGNVYSEFPEDSAVYELQLKRSIEALNMGYYQTLAISGGYTKKQLEKNEAQGMLDWSLDLGLNIDRARVILEQYARDSFENVLFSMCRFYEEFSKFPESVTVCSWRSKKMRFAIIANVLSIPCYSFFGVGNKKELKQQEAKLCEVIRYDPFHRGLYFAQKRLLRDPWNKGNPYAKIDKFSKMFEILNLMEKKELTDPALVNLPWV